MRTCSKCGGTEFDEVYYRCVNCDKVKPKYWKPADPEGEVPPGEGEGQGSAKGKGEQGEDDGDSAEDMPLEGAGEGSGEGEGEGEGDPPPPDQIVLYPGEIVRFGVDDAPFYLVADVSPSAFGAALKRQATIARDYDENLLFTVSLEDGKVRLRTERLNLQYSPTNTLGPGDVLERNGNTEIVGKYDGIRPDDDAYTLLNMETGGFDGIKKAGVAEMTPEQLEKLVDKTPKPKRKGR